MLFYGVKKEVMIVFACSSQRHHGDNSVKHGSRSLSSRPKHVQSDRKHFVRNSPVQTSIVYADRRQSYLHCAGFLRGQQFRRCQISDISFCLRKKAHLFFTCYFAKLLRIYHINRLVTITCVYNFTNHLFSYIYSSIVMVEEQLGLL